MAKVAKEIMVTTDNKIGTLAKVTEPLKSAEVNILAICAWGEEDKAHFVMLTENSQKAVEALRNAGFETKEQEVVTVSLENQAGTLAVVGQKLGEGGVDINYCYLTAQGDKALGVLNTKNNAKAVEVLA